MRRTHPVRAIATMEYLLSTFYVLTLKTQVHLKSKSLSLSLHKFRLFLETKSTKFALMRCSPIEAIYWGAFVMERTEMRTFKVFVVVFLLWLLEACTPAQLGGKAPNLPETQAGNLQLLNRVTWGANAGSLDEIDKLGRKKYLEIQLHPKETSRLPAAATAQIAAMQISQKNMVELVEDAEHLRKQGDLGSEENKQAARKEYQRFLNSLSQESAQRFMLRAVYSPNQLQEQLTWFWLNHFSVHDRKNNIRAMIGDYEDQAIRPHVLGRFRDLLGATVHHPAMLAYLDNEKNVAGHINENYARELMELHTLGIDGGYSQHDVQELARILTGLGVERGDRAGKASSSIHKNRKMVIEYEKNLVVFNDRKHDSGSKMFLGEKIKSQGVDEINEVLDRLSRNPATAHFISRKLATYFMADEPSAATVDAMAQTFLTHDGDISTVLRTLFNSSEFNDSLNKKFKDPVHYVVSSLRVLYENTPIITTSPAVGWLDKLGEPLYGHQTPDGYPLTQSNWNSPGQMTARFDVARIMGTTTMVLLPMDAAGKNNVPELKESNYRSLFQAQLSAGVQQALTQAKSPQEWNTFFLSSPEFMNR